VNNYVNGSIQGHQTEVSKILNQIANDPNDDVIIAVPTAQSHLLNRLALNEAPHFSVNKVMAEYYGRNSVRIGETD
jgi:hypothetical protein